MKNIHGHYYNKMDNAGFEEDIPMIHQDKEDDDYDNYNTPNASKIDETSFIEMMPQNQHQPYA